MTSAERLARAVAAAENIEEAKAAAARVLARRPKIAKPPPPGRTREERRAKEDAETARIRVEVDRRDEGCVICLEPAPEPWELHHVDSGSGKTQRQSVRNCCKSHEGCHKAAHRGSLAALHAILRWARFHGYSETEAVVMHRIAKIEEARRTPSVPVRVEVGT